MSSMIERGGSILALSGALFGCSLDDLSRAKHRELTSKQYHQIDSGHYRISAGGGGLLSDIAFQNHLAQFRREVPGDFIIIPSDPSEPLHHDALAIRVSVQTDGAGVNRIVCIQSETSDR